MQIIRDPIDAVEVKVLNLLLTFIYILYFLRLGDLACNLLLLYRQILN